MADPKDAPTPAAITVPALPEPMDSTHLLSGATSEYFNDKTHVGVAVQLVADGRKSYLMIPDIAMIGNGAPVYITAPVRLNGEHLKDYLVRKGVNLGDKVAGFLKKSHVSCEALYYAKATEKLATEKEADEYNAIHHLEGEARKRLNDDVETGTLLMVFEVGFGPGIISDLVDPELGNLFDVQGMTVRVLRCPGRQRPILEAYVKQLQAA